MSDKIYAANIHLFAFHPRKALVVGDKPENISRDWVATKYGEILKKFDIKQPISLRSDTPNSSRFFLLPQPDDKTLKQPNNKIKKFQRIPDKGEIRTRQGLTVTGLAYPLQIEDSYALTLNLRIPQGAGKDALEIAQLKDFNPDNCFLPEFVKSELGQTLLITAFLAEEQKPQARQIADKCVAAFLNLADATKYPPFYQAGELFDSPIFEYGNPKEGSTDSGHIIVWFFANEAATEKFNQCYWDFPDVLLYRHKITNSYQNSRADKKVFEEKLGELEAFIGNLELKWKLEPKLGLTEAGGLAPQSAATSSAHKKEEEFSARADLEDLKEKLQKLLRMALQYSKLLRNLEYERNGIAINKRNYKTKVKEIQGLAESNLDFLKLFAQREARTMHKQIEADLNYFVHGSGLLDRAIDTIRGLIEIEKAERDRQLQVTVFVVGTVIGAGGIFASSYTLRYATTPIQIPYISLQLPAPIKPVHPVTKAIFYSISFGALAGVIAYFIAKIIFPQRRKKK